MVLESNQSFVKAQMRQRINLHVFALSRNGRRCLWRMIRRNLRLLGSGVNESFALGFQVYKQYLPWALKPVNITYIGLFGSVCTPINSKFPFHFPFDSPVPLSYLGPIIPKVTLNPNITPMGSFHFIFHLLFHVILHYLWAIWVPGVADISLRIKASFVCRRVALINGGTCTHTYGASPKLGNPSGEVLTIRINIFRGLY